MRISSIETIPVALPFRRRYLTSAGALDRREMLIVRLTDADGTVGHGDAVPLSLRGGESLAQVRAAIDEVFAPALTATELDAEVPDALDAIGPLLDGFAAAGAGSQAIAGAEMALLDLIGRHRGAPVWSLLGATEAHPVPCNGTLGADSSEQAVAEAGALAADGFTTLKVKVGTAGDAERMRAVRDVVGDAVALRVDANGAWDMPTARLRIEELSEVGLELAEQPCASIEELTELRALVDTPIVADESADTPEAAAAAFEAGACDAVTIKLAKVGGIRAALRVADGAPSYLSSALDSPLGIAAAAHAAQALPTRGFATGLAHGLATSGLFADNVADDSALRGPSIDLGDVPGLGIEVDEAALERLRIR